MPDRLLFGLAILLIIASVYTASNVILGLFGGGVVLFYPNYNRGAG